MKQIKTLTLLLLSVILIIQGVWVCELKAEAASAPRIISGTTYYIKNVNSGQYLTVTGSGDTASAMENVVQMRLGTVDLDRQRWRVDYMSTGYYRIVSEASPAGVTLSLDMYANNSNNSENIDVFTDYDAADRRWEIILNSDGCSYRIMSRCSNSTRAVTVSGASCSEGANVFQYQYNATKNDEWIFEPVFNYSQEMGCNYAIQNYNRFYYTYPGFDNSFGHDCANFVSQCMLAGGIHFQNQWWVYKKNNNYNRPASSSQLDESWDLQTMGGFLGIGASSPWISAKMFCKYWSAHVTYTDYTGSYILNNPSTVYQSPYYKGDAVSIMSSGEAFHTMYITGYGQHNGTSSFLLTYHSNNSCNVNLLTLASQYPDCTFRFYTIN